MLPPNPLKPKLFYLFGGTLIGISLFLGFIKYSSAFPLASTNSGPDDQTVEEIKELNQNLQTRRQEIEELKKKAEQYREKIITQRNQAFSLKNQISILDTQIAKTKVEIKAKEQEIELSKLDIQEAKVEIELLKKRINQQKEKIAQVLRVIYQNDEKSYLEILLMNDSLSDFFNAAKFIENLHTGLHKRLLLLKDAQDQLDSS
jgi:peptidoglycan hydrolase CwlO-like protein